MTYIIECENENEQERMCKTVKPISRRSFEDIGTVSTASQATNQQEPQFTEKYTKTKLISHISTPPVYKINKLHNEILKNPQNRDSTLLVNNIIPPNIMSYELRDNRIRTRVDNWKPNAYIAPKFSAPLYITDVHETTHHKFVHNLTPEEYRFMYTSKVSCKTLSPRSINSNPMSQNTLKEVNKRKKQSLWCSLMANRTDPTCRAIHNSNPQYLISKIARSCIYSSLYWKEKCFGLTAESIIDKAIELTCVGGLYGGSAKPTEFYCLLLKLLQIQPPLSVVLEYLNNEEFKYLTVLAALYLRFTGDGLEIYSNLEPLLADYRKIKVRNLDGQFTIKYMDEIIEEMLEKSVIWGIELPNLPKRKVIEQKFDLPKRVSSVRVEYDLLNGAIDDVINDKIKS